MQQNKKILIYRKEKFFFEKKNVFFLNLYLSRYVILQDCIAKIFFSSCTVAAIRDDSPR